jgi:PAS domain S-box-containing protein
LENNEFCLWITSQPLEVEEAIEALRRAVPDLETYMEKGQIEIISYTCLHLTGSNYDSEMIINDWIEKLNHSLKNGYEGLRLSGNTYWMGKKYWELFSDHMGKMEDIIEKYRIIALGSYFVDKYSAVEILEIVSKHQFSLIKKEEKWECVDNFGRKKAEEAAFRATMDWEYTFDAVPDMIAVLDEEYKIVRANRAMAAKLGMTPKECVGLTCYRVVHGTDEPPTFCPHKQLLKDGFEHTTEMCEDYLGGDCIVSVSPLHNFEGKLTRCIHVARDINERKQEEHRIRRYNSILEGMNHIFRNVVQAKTEEELGNACLSIALKITGSKIGFVGEVSATGLLHDIAISKGGRDQCFMYDKTGHRRRPGDFILRGLYGSVVNSGKSFFTNNPQLDPNSIGLIHGHPSLTSFLGVPLIQDEKTIGVLVVANRDGGYNCEQQEDLEAIAPAVIQVLQRKKVERERVRAEEALKNEHENLERLVKERTKQLEEAYDSLKESERGLAQAQKMSHIGNWDWNIITNEIYWSDELYRIFGRDAQESAPIYNEYLDYIHPKDQDHVNSAFKKALNGDYYSIDYRILLADGEERTVHEQSEIIFEKNTPIRIIGIVQDITESKRAKETLVNIETARKKEIHHRIKNNLQVISSLLDLQAEKFSNREDIKNSAVMEAFRESQDRVISMALIHEELHEGGEDDTVSFAPYLEKLIGNLFQTYKIGNNCITLSTDLEENILFDMDTAVPLGIIVNELVSNSLKHAFTGQDKGKIQIKLRREASKNEGCKIISFTLTVSDDGVGIPEKLDIEDLDSLGFQLVASLVDQLDGEFELKRSNGTEFTMRFTVTEK